MAGDASPATDSPSTTAAVDWDPRGAGGVAAQWETGRVGPGSVQARAHANVEALRVLARLRDHGATASLEDQRVLARWTSWGALPRVVEDRDGQDQAGGGRQNWLGPVREQVTSLLDEKQRRQAQRTILNAHYTDPRVIDRTWTHLRDLGFDQGTVLEPGCGSGSFIGLAPTGAQMVGVELDSTTAEIAAHLYPSATIRAESFADTALPAHTFHAVIGNVPFGDYRLYDPLHNPQRHTIHNHFILKSIALTAPGGTVAVLTSRYTLDSADAAARRAMYDHADLISAVRLPTGAHRESAATDAVTDLLVFRVREPGKDAGADTWLASTAREIPDSTNEGSTVTIRINDWWTHRPSAVLGQMSAGHGMYGANTLNVHAEQTWLTDLDGELSRQAAQLTSAGIVHTAHLDPDAPASDLSLPRAAAAGMSPAAGGALEGRISYQPQTTSFTELAHGVEEPLAVPATQSARLRALLGLRDAQLAVLEREAASPDDTEDLTALRAALVDRYRSYVDRWGPINSVTAHRRTGSDGTEVLTYRRPPVMRIFDRDPYAPAVRGLESTYDPETNTAAPATILSRRVVDRTAHPERADTAADALAVALDEHAEVDLDRIASLLDTTVPDARAQLGDLVYDNPTTGGLVPAEEYLSGNVRTKLAAAAEAAREDGRFSHNVDALTRVIPPDLQPADITARLGATWIPARDVEDFLQTTLRDPSVRIEHAGGAHWNVRGGTRYSAAATQTFGTDRMDAHTIAQRLLEQRPLIVRDEVEIGDTTRRVVNATATAAAQDKGAALQHTFSEWLWSDQERSERLCALYNERFNCLVLRDYTAAGQRLTLPGLAKTFTPHPHQRTAVARMIGEPSVGLWHAVGAGKTAAMVMGTTELTRLGLVDKPAVLVPNHMLEQFTREWMQLYPRARLLAAGSEDLRGEDRRRFIARAAMGQWDAVILTHGAFKLLPVSKQTEIAYVEDQTDKLRTSLGRLQSDGTNSFTAKQIEKRIASLEEKLAANLERPTDSGLTWEQTGIDYLVVDELHLYKNLPIASNITGINTAGSQLASDLDLKVGWLRQRAIQRAQQPTTTGPTGPTGDGRAETGPDRRPVRVMTGATATPIANSISEAWVMMHYLRPDLLEAADVDDFDAWAGTFATTTTELELAPEGGYRTKTRFARFDNLPELLRVWHIAADTRTADQLDLPGLPQLAPRPEDGQRAPQAVVIESSPELSDYMLTLADRAEEIRNGAGGGPGEDNMLVVTNDGRKAALDLRMLTRTQREPIASTPSKVDVVADQVHRIWSATRDTAYLETDGTPSSRTGGLQIVFADLGTPSTDPARPWSFYTELRDQLTARGMDPGRIRFAHEATNAARTAQLFAQCRGGQVDVIVGSTAKMGVGTNIQARAVALHHVDCPWRPADVEQREGRALRQGNQNPEIEILRYVTSRSFDAYSWQTVERKQRFITQVMHGTLTDRGAADDIAGAQTLSFSEVKALASGNPLILERAQAEQDLARLQRLARAHEQTQRQRRSTLRTAEHTEPRILAAIAATEQLLEQRVETSSDTFRLTLDGTVYTQRADAADALRGRCRRALAANRDMAATQPFARLQVGGVGFSLETSYGLGTGHVIAHVDGLTTAAVSFDDDDLRRDGIGPITRLEHRVSSLQQHRDQHVNDLNRLRDDRADAERGLALAFAHHDELTETQARLDRLDSALTSDNSQTAANTPHDTTPTATAEPAAHSDRAHDTTEITRLMNATHPPADAAPHSDTTTTDSTMRPAQPGRGSHSPSSEQPER